MTDQVILARIARGEREAYAELVRRYQQALFGYLGRMGLTQAQASDLAQDTFLRAWLHLHQFDPTRAQFGTWLHTIARNLACSFLSKHYPTENLPDGESAELVCPQPDPMQRLQSKQEHARLVSALRQLPTAERSAIALAYGHDLSLTDVARIEGVSLVAIKTRLHRARQALRRLLDAPSPPEKRHG